MNAVLACALALLPALAAVGVLFWRICRRRHLDRWLGSELAQARSRRRRAPHEPVHLLLAIADHYEPQWGRPDPDTARDRVARWIEAYPRLFGDFRDSDGRPPRHTFFFPIDEYAPEHVDALAALCRAGFGEIEIHHHHDGDNSEALRERLLRFKTLFADRHGVLSRHRGTGALAYGFIHGNWALDNSRPDGRWCGVNNELDILRETGCYADFTYPSHPDPTQPRTINQIYYAIDDPDQPRSHETGIPIGAGPPPANALMLIPGPLTLDWTQRRWGVVPRIENSCIQGNQPARIDRLDAWLAAGIRVPNRPDWFFVKLHTHGAPESNQRALLGEPMVRFHRDLAARAAADPNFHYHYVTARELYNLAKAAEAGWTRSVEAARDFLLTWNGLQDDPLGRSPRHARAESAT